MAAHRGPLGASIALAAAAPAVTSPPRAARAEPWQTAPTEGAGVAEAAKLACLGRHEDAERMRRGGKLLAARSSLLACSRASCPAAVRADCVDWLEDVSRSVP